MKSKHDQCVHLALIDNSCCYILFYDYQCIFKISNILIAQVTTMSSLDWINLLPGSTVLLLWSGNQMSSDMQEIATSVSDKVRNGSEGRIQLEHIDRLLMCKYYYWSLPNLFKVSLIVLYENCCDICSLKKDILAYLKASLLI